MSSKGYQRKKSEKWTGILATPRSLPVFAQVESMEGENPVDHVIREVSERINALYEHYRIDSKESAAADKILIIKLAEECGIPGFKTTIPGQLLKKVGNTSKWKKTPLGLRLYVGVQKIILQNNNCSIISACKKLIKDNREFEKENPDNLQQRYKDIVKWLGKDACKDFEVILACNNTDFQSAIGICLDSKAPDNSPTLSNPGVIKGFAKIARSIIG